MNNTATKQPRLIPYPVIEAAIAGETDAVNEVIRHYAIIIPTLISYSSSSFLDMITQFISLAIIILFIILAFYLLIKNKLPSKKHILISLILTILVSISYIGLNTDPSTILLNSVFSGISTLFCSLAVFSVMEKNTDIKFIERNKIGSTIIISIIMGVILSVFNCLLMLGNNPLDFEISAWRLLACLNPAIFEEMSGRAIFMAYCLYKIGNEKPSKFCSFTMIFMMSVPHTFSHGYGVIETLVLLVLFGLPLTVLQRKRGITSAMISHGTIDAIRFTIWGLVL